MPRFSVIIPLYNKAPYVAKAIQSVLDQTFMDYELIIMDDGSRDDSFPIALKTIDGRGNCHLFRQENAGVSMARNNAVAVSQGEYLCFLDADDWWEPTFLEEITQLIEDFPEAGIYGTNYTIVNETKHKTRVAKIGVEDGFEKGYINYCKAYASTMYMPLTSISVAIPRKVFEEAGGFPQGIKLGEDFLLWIRIALKYKVAFLNKPLAYYNQDVDSSHSGTHKKEYDPDAFMTFYFGQFDKEEKENHDLKALLDQIRVYSLMSFRKHNLYPEKVRCEIDKVDFRNVEPKYRFYYKAPYLLVNAYCRLFRLLSQIRQKIVLL